jgi:hypothetical protein
MSVSGRERADLSGNGVFGKLQDRTFRKCDFAEGHGEVALQVKEAITSGSVYDASQRIGAVPRTPKLSP